MIHAVFKVNTGRAILAPKVVKEVSTPEAIPALSATVPNIKGYSIPKCVFEPIFFIS